jgi:hypothetical protein
MGQQLSKDYGISPPSFGSDIESYLQWKERGNINQLTRCYRSRSETREYYRWLCQRLSYEHGVYMPPSLPYQSNWKSLFFELYALRNLWSKVDINDDNNDLQTSSTTTSERFKISVYARFKPQSKISNDETNDTDDDANTFEMR